MQWLVITDLDGTLLNHHNYHYDAAMGAITALQNKNVPVILNTSKTFAETVTIRQALGISDPFVVENGSCIYLPISDFSEPSVGAEQRDDYWALMLGSRQSEIADALALTEMNKTAYTRLSQCTIEQAVNLTGLSSAQAEQAIAREYSEPIIWQADNETLDVFKQQLSQHQLTTLQGGRFLHVIGQCDKGQAVEQLKRIYGESTQTIALGDSANDAAMLANADISVIVNSPSNAQLDNMIKPDIRTTQSAPEGWDEAIQITLSKIKTL